MDTHGRHTARSVGGRHGWWWKETEESAHRMNSSGLHGGRGLIYEQAGKPIIRGTSQELQKHRTRQLWARQRNSTPVLQIWAKRRGGVGRTGPSGGRQ
jgi:hypothetical protein